MSLNASPTAISEIEASTASEFWALLSPEKPLFPRPCTLLYRGQSDSSWGLVPSILRYPERILGVPNNGGLVYSDFQVFKEFIYLMNFVNHCDSIGLQIPNDSPEFRKLYLNQNAPAGLGRAFIETALWPAPELFALLALAQHHGLPTRLLDWSTRSYVAAYFSISDALKDQQRTGESDRLAVWVLDVTSIQLFPRLEMIRVPGSNNANLAAQAGMFTLLRQQGVRGEAFEGDISLDQYFLNQNLPVPLMKVTLPVAEAKAALGLCGLYGITGATIFPDFYGAARGAKDLMNTTIYRA